MSTLQLNLLYKQSQEVNSSQSLWLPCRC